MIYGNGSGTCALCDDKIDRHRFIIKSSEESNKLARSLSDALAKIYEKTDNKESLLYEGTLLMGHQQQDRDGVMLGAIIAKIKDGTTIKAVALSGGPGVQKIFDVMNTNLGKDVDLVSALPAGNELYNIQGYKIPQDSLPPLSLCAAQKLISHVMSKNTAHATDFIKEINMSEVYFKTNDTKSNYSSNPDEPVESCATCKGILPMMLCDKFDFAMV